jgi:hypothetical protein
VTDPPAAHRLPALRLAAAATLFAFLLSLAHPTSTQPSSGTSLTGAPQLARAYEAIFDARFDEVPRLLDIACGARIPAPAPRAAAATPVRPGSAAAPVEACALLDLLALWWQIQLDPDSLSLDARFAARADAVIEAVGAWTMREPARAEAWFYLGGAYGARAQWRVLRGERLAAARDGRQIKEALERALTLDPMLHDAHFGIGLYRYYAGVAPTLARMLRWLLALPGGNREEGLRDMLRARRSGALVRDEADYQLHLVYLWYEKQPEEALTLVRGLARRFAHHPHFLSQAATIEGVHLSDFAAAHASWSALLTAARRAQVAAAPAAEMQARVGLAGALDQLYETDVALDHLGEVIDARPASPFGIYALALLRRAQALDRLGHRTDAVAAYRAAQDARPARDPHDIDAQARAGLRSTPDPQKALAYRLSLEGWRALERGALATAAQRLQRALELEPADQVTRYREARLLEAQQDDVAAIERYEGVMLAGTATPPTFYASAALHAARLYERQGDRTRARALYERAATAFGVDATTKDAATRALARLR